MSKYPDGIKYSVATNFDPEIIHEISRNNTNGEFKTVFGKFRSDIFGGGRPSIVLKNIGFKELRTYTDLCHSNGLKFDYLINSLCMGNREVIPSSHRKMIDFINKLIDCGVDCVTVSSPYLCQIVKSRFPNLEIIVSQFAYVTTLQQLKQWQEMGANEVTLFNSISRNFPLLTQMLEYTKGKKLSLRIVANNICLHACPFSVSHATSISHASQRNNTTRNFLLDCNMTMCTYQKLRNPVNLITSEWIRPEDIATYERVCKNTGNYNFCIKLLDRSKSTSFICRVIKAYAERKYEGNLLDLLTYPLLKETSTFHTASMIFQALLDRYKIREVQKMKKFYELPSININNSKLDGFIDFFVMQKQYSCDSKICANDSDDQDKNVSIRERCTYCSSWVQKAITYDKKDLDRWLGNVGDILTAFNNSKFFS